MIAVPCLNSHRNFSGFDGANHTPDSAAFDRSERFHVCMDIDGNRRSATILLSELKPHDFATRTIVGLWLVSDDVKKDTPEVDIHQGSRKVLARLVEEIVETGSFTRISGKRASYGIFNLTEPAISGGSFFFQSRKVAADGYLAMARIVACHIDYESKEPSSAPNRISPFVTPAPDDKVMQLTRTLIAAHPTHAAALVELYEVLRGASGKSLFTVANSIQNYLDRKNLRRLIPEALALLAEIWSDLRHP